MDDGLAVPLAYRHIAMGAGVLAARAAEAALSAPARLVAPVAGAALGSPVLGPARRTAERALGDLADLGGRWEAQARLTLEQAGQDLLRGPLIDQLVAALAEARVIERIVERLLDEEVAERIVVVALESPTIDRIVERVLESPGVERAVERVLESNLRGGDHRASARQRGAPARRGAHSQQPGGAKRDRATVVRVGGRGCPGGALAQRDRRRDRGANRAVGPPSPASAARRWALVTARPGVPYAGLVTRSLALGVDLLAINAAIGVIGAVIGLVASMLNLGDLNPDALVVAALLGAWWLLVSSYLILFWTLVGQTPGMSLMHLRVVARDGRRPGLGQSIVRLVGMVLAAIPLMAGYALILFDDRRQGLQDKLARTFVLYVPEEAELELEPPVVQPEAAMRSAANPRLSLDRP